MSLMGLDIGTTGVKGVVFDSAGKLLTTAYEEYPLHFPFPGASELDSQQVVAAACRVIMQAAGVVKASDPIQSVGIASQGEAFTPITSEGWPLGNGMTSADNRAESLVKPWSDEFGADRLYGITGHTPYAMYSLYKLLWIKLNSPDIWQNAWKFLFYEDLVAFVLTGETVTDYTMAARSMLFDVKNKEWSSEILNCLGLDGSRLPTTVPPGSVVGTVRPKLANSLGLGENVKVVVGGHDQPVGALGCGATTPGSAGYSIGSNECICPAVDRLITNRELMEANLAMYPHVLPKTYTTVAFSTTGGSVLRWVRDNLAVEETAEAHIKGENPYNRIIAAAETMPSRLVLIPQFGPTGTPHFDPHGTGVLFGLNLSTRRAEVLRAVLEGITYEMKMNLCILAEAGFKLDELRAVGGGSRSETWMQIKADILGVPIITMQVPEATCMGAAILAAQGAGLHGAKEAAAAWARPVREFSPRPEYKSAYDERFEIYKELYGALAAARSMLHELKEA